MLAIDFASIKFLKTSLLHVSWNLLWLLTHNSNLEIIFRTITNVHLFEEMIRAAVLKFALCIDHLLIQQHDCNHICIYIHCLNMTLQTLMFSRFFNVYAITKTFSEERASAAELKLCVYIFHRDTVTWPH